MACSTRNKYRATMILKKAFGGRVYSTGVTLPDSSQQTTKTNARGRQRHTYLKFSFSLYSLFLSFSFLSLPDFTQTLACSPHLSLFLFHTRSPSHSSYTHTLSPIQTHTQTHALSLYLMRHSLPPSLVSLIRHPLSRHLYLSSASSLSVYDSLTRASLIPPLSRPLL